jgi:hypothetical protein
MTRHFRERLAAGRFILEALRTICPTLKRYFVGAEPGAPTGISIAAKRTR